MRYTKIMRAFKMSHSFPVPSRIWQEPAVGSATAGTNCGHQIAIDLRDPPSGIDLTAKRALDLALSIVVLIALFPLLALASIAIKLDSRGPVILRRGRYGFDRSEFAAYSFRTTHGRCARRAACREDAAWPLAHPDPNSKRRCAKP